MHDVATVRDVREAVDRAMSGTAPLAQVKTSEGLALLEKARIVAPDNVEPVLFHLIEAVEQERGAAHEALRRQRGELESIHTNKRPAKWKFFEELSIEVCRPAALCAWATAGPGEGLERHFCVCDTLCPAQAVVAH